MTNPTNSDGFPTDDSAVPSIFPIFFEQLPSLVEVTDFFLMMRNYMKCVLWNVLSWNDELKAEDGLLSEWQT
jgi:hypothetical protein